MTELNRQVEAEGVTLTVLAAYADRHQTAVMFTLTGAPEVMQALWEATAHGDDRLSAVLRSGRTGPDGMTRGSSLTFDPEHATVNGLIWGEPLAWWSSYQLTLEIGPETLFGGPGIWKVDFPVQWIAANRVETVTVDRSFSVNDQQITRLSSPRPPPCWTTPSVMPILAVGVQSAGRWERVAATSHVT
ncbi:MAG: hypothetical protein AB1331_08410 [Bacillota bacterium]